MDRKAPLPPSGYSPNKLGKMVGFKSFPNFVGEVPEGRWGPLIVMYNRPAHKGERTRTECRLKMMDQFK